MKDHKSLKNKRILILGIGNILLGDEGTGVHAIRYMKEHPFPGNVRFLDGGTGGFNLLTYMQEYNPVILIDATNDNDPPGTLHITKPRYSSDFPKTLGAHDIGLKDLIESAILLDSLPEIILITISIHLTDKLSMELSPALRKTLPEIENKVREILTMYP
ncbi:MAG TPA: hydrogenase maturation protease [Bacteroidetes bacterium]|nr:hydrogenase maturation protease [Bacteroidota bacterium]